MGAVFFALVTAVTLNGAIVMYRDTFRDAAVPAPAATCSEGLRGLYRDFTAALATVRQQGDRAVPQSPSRDPAAMAALGRLDEQLLALRPVCAREGASAREAYDSLTLWRYRAEDLSRVEERVLNPDAERALRYQSPADPASHPTSGTRR